MINKTIPQNGKDLITLIYNRKKFTYNVTQSKRLF